MKKLSLLFASLFTSLLAGAQNPSYLFGSYWNSSIEISRHLDYSTGVFTNLTTLTGVSSLAQGESTYDHINKRYFNKTNLGITVSDALTGSLLSVVNTTVPLKGIEYNSNTGDLIGTYWNGSAEIFASLNISTGALTNIATLAGVTTIAQGESTFDHVGNRYFNKTGTPSICVINASTGLIINSINNLTFKGLEFNSNIGQLVGSYWTGTAEVFASMDITTGAITNIGSLMGVTSVAQGETTFDASGNVYFNKTNLGTTVINAQSGAILNSVPGMTAIKGIEFIGNINFCDFSLNMNSPAHIYTNQGSSASFSCSTNAPTPSYQWQSNPANFGWMNIPNNSSYSGATSSVLSVNSVLLQNHMQHFRVIVTSGTCVDTSVVSTLHISDTCIVADTVVITDLREDLYLQNADLSIYPNPAQNYLIIDVGNFLEINECFVKIITNAGQQLLRQKITQKQMRIDLSSISAKGMYYLQILDSKNTIIGSEKIIIGK